jgi:hypothetical protein
MTGWHWLLIPRWLRSWLLCFGHCSVTLRLQSCSRPACWAVFGPGDPCVLEKQAATASMRSKRGRRRTLAAAGRRSTRSVNVAGSGAVLLWPVHPAAMRTHKDVVLALSVGAVKTRTLGHMGFGAPHTPGDQEEEEEEEVGAPWNNEIGHRELEEAGSRLVGESLAVVGAGCCDTRHRACHCATWFRHNPLVFRIPGIVPGC